MKVKDSRAILRIDMEFECPAACWLVFFFPCSAFSFSGCYLACDNVRDCAARQQQSLKNASPHCQSAGFGRILWHLGFQALYWNKEENTYKTFHIRAFSFEGENFYGLLS